MELTVEEFIKLRNLIYNRAGIFFETKKIYFVKKRLQKRMETLQIEDFTTYQNHLQFKDKFGQEMQNLLNLMTTNETYFFREENQLKAFVEHSLPEIMKYKQEAKTRRIRIWSAGCSSGEEPYTLAIMLREKLLDLSTWTVEIFATDIDTEILSLAQLGEYESRSVRMVPPYLLVKHFTKKNDKYNVIPHIKEMVHFRHLNLMDSVKMRAMRGIDFIFCRNVLIYFDDNSRKSVVANFYDSLNPGGYIYLGHSESITRISTAFTIKRGGGLIVHQKPWMKEV